MDKEAFICKMKKKYRNTVTIIAFERSKYCKNNIYRQGESIWT